MAARTALYLRRRSPVATLALACALATACREATPSTGPSAARAVVDIAPFATAVRLGAAGGITYATTLGIRETAGVSATISSITMTLVERSGTSTTNDIAPADAFPTATIDAGGTLTSRAISIYGPPPFDTALVAFTVARIVARVAFTDARGNNGVAEHAAETGFDLTGSWTGGRIGLPAAGDWSSVRVSLTQTGGVVSGEMVSRDGTILSLNSSLLTRDGITFALPGACGTQTGGVSLILQTFEYSAGRVQQMSGFYTGRCSGTVAGQLTLQRAG
jgi:hypothetical protein